jgi:hypothetical protein
MADNAQNLPLPQPNFPLLSQSYLNIANEVAKIPNAPQFDAGNAILRQLRQIDENINTRLDGVVQQIQQMVQQIQQMSTRITSLDARVQIR